MIFLVKKGARRRLLPKKDRSYARLSRFKVAMFPHYLVTLQAVFDHYKVRKLELTEINTVLEEHSVRSVCFMCNFW